MTERVLIVCVDIDNDIKRKTKQEGPIVGEEENKKVAIQLAISDPEDTDANVIFYGIKLARQLKKEKEVLLVTLTGDQRLGIYATMRILDQLEKIVREFNPDYAIFVSDGRSDEEVLPLINAKVKVKAKKTIIMKQAKELEKTYFVLLEKLRDPYYAKILLGIPAIILLSLSLMALFQIPWQIFVFFLGLYMLIKGFGFDEMIAGMIKEYSFSGERPTWWFFVAFAFSLLITLVNGAVILLNEEVESAIRTVKALITIIDGLAISLVFLFAGKLIEHLLSNNPYKRIATIYRSYVVFVLLYLADSFLRWLIGEVHPFLGTTVSFDIILYHFLLISLLSIMIAYLYKVKKQHIIEKMELKGKDVLYRNGFYVGRAVGIKGDKIVVETPFDTKTFFDVERIDEIVENRIYVGE